MTKVHDCLTEGARRFLARCAALEAGTECERWGGALAALAGGEATAAQLADLRQQSSTAPGPPASPAAAEFGP